MSSTQDLVVALKAELRASGIRDYLAVPMVFADRSINVLTVSTCDPRGFSDDDVARLQALMDRMLGPNSLPNLQLVNIHHVLERVRDLVLAEAGEGCMATIEMPKVHPLIAPLVYAVPVQLLAYHVACAKGTDVDQPRNLAKSVTVE